MNEPPRDCERHCPKCGEWKHHSRFRSKRRKTRHGLVTEFRRICKSCEQIERNENKNEDRPLALMRARTTSHAHRLGVPFHFLWVNMNWRARVPVFRAMQSPEGRCLDCGHRFENERDIQIEHREPPRHPQDWARQHTRNLGLGCKSCNGTKTDKPFAVWLDEQEDARLSNEAHRIATDPPPPAVAVQLTFEV